MSTKTLRKRIALVAVSALTAGLFSVASAPVANAADATPITKADIYMKAATESSSLSIGQCSIAASALLTDARTVGTTNSTGSVLAVGAIVEFETATNGAGNLVITGPAVWNGIAANTTTGTISQDGKSIGFRYLGAQQLKVTGTGDITVTAYDNSAIGSGSSVKTFGISAVASCASADSPVAANSIFTIRNNADEGASATNTDDPLDITEKDYDSQIFIAVELKNQYKADLATPGILTAEATGNALVAFDGDPLLSATAFKSTAATVGNQVDLKVKQNTTVAPGAPLSTTITFKFNGAVVGTKNVTILGAPAKIVVSDVTVGVQAGTGSFKYIVTDAADNRLQSGSGITPAHGSTTGAVAGVTYAGIVSDAKGTAGTTTSAAGDGTFTCAAFSAGTSSGSQDIQIGFLVGTTLVKSNTFKATCGSAGVGSWTVAMDKAVYSPGEIATLTITAKDLNGGVVADTAVIGAAYDKISIAGMTIIGAAISSADVFTSGVKTYKYRVDQNEGSFVGQAQVTTTTGAATAETTVKTLQYSVKQSGTTVTNADVLKSIVSLIASINKQIRALQKLILRR
jgi:hypothetical protein